MIRDMVMGGKYFLVETHLRESIKIINLMEKEHIFGLMDLAIRDCGKMELNVDLEDGRDLKENITKVNGKTTKQMASVN